jgi:diacylglycerol O-acyltransferase / wax synthase
MRQFTSLDAQFIAAEDGRVHGHVTGLAIYDPSTTPTGTLDAVDVRAVIADRIHLVPPFHRKMVTVPLGLDLPYWTDDPDFDLNRHLYTHRLEAPGDERALAALVGKILGTPLDLERPPWAIHVIEGLEGGRVALATSIHHAASDGIGMAEMFAILHDPSPEVRRLGPAVIKLERSPGRLEMLARGVIGMPKQPVRFARSLPRALPHLDQVLTMRPIPGVPTLAALGRSLLVGAVEDRDGRLLEPVSTLAPRTVTTGRVSPQRTVAFGTTPLSEVKAIKNHFGVTVNDVVMAIIAGGLRTWLENRGELPDAPLAAMVPISVRASGPDGSDPFGRPGEAFGNRIAMMLPQVRTDIADPAARLAATHDVMRAAKERHQAVPATLLQDANHFIPPVLLARAARASAIVASSPLRGAAANVLISNIPGAREPQYLAGARLEAHFPLSAIFHGLGLNVTVVSYCDQVDWGIAGDPEQIGDAWTMLDDVLAAQTELMALVPQPVAALS